MKNKQYPLHHDHGTVKISRDAFDSMTSELERLRPMETGLELAEADRDAYKKRVEELADKYKELAKDHDKAIQACCDADKRIAKLQHALWIARAERAEAELKKWNARAHYAIVNSDREEQCFKWMKVWRTVECKCRAKAKEFE